MTPLNLLISGLCLVFGPVGGTFRNILVPIRSGYGYSPQRTTSRYVSSVFGIHFSFKKKFLAFYSWDSFPLFLILNDYLRTDDNLKNGKFHQHLRTTFAPQVVRYVDLMESSIAQSIHKGFEKERWEIKGYFKIFSY